MGTSIQRALAWSVMGKKDDNKGAAGVVLGIGAAIAGLYAWIRSRSATPGQELIPDELAKLWAAMAASLDRIDVSIGKLAIAVQGWPPNTKYIRSFTMVCVAANTPYQVPAMVIPSGMHLLVKAHPFNAAASLIQVATSASECLNVNSSWPLVLNEPVAFAIENAQDIFISTNIAGSQAIFVAEERRE